MEGSVIGSPNKPDSPFDAPDLAFALHPLMPPDRRGTWWDQRRHGCQPGLGTLTSFTHPIGNRPLRAIRWVQEHRLPAPVLYEPVLFFGEVASTLRIVIRRTRIKAEVKFKIPLTEPVGGCPPLLLTGAVKHLEILL